MRWKWQNRQKFNKDKRRPFPGRRCPANSGLLANADLTSITLIDCEIRQCAPLSYAPNILSLTT